MLLIVALALLPAQELRKPYANAAAVPAELKDADLLAVVLGRNDGAGARDNLVARATVPLAAGDFDPAKHSLAVHDVAAGKVFAAQADVVAVRGDGTPEVIEALFPASIPAGGSREYALFRWPDPAPPPAAAEPKLPKLVARCRDALGRTYSAEPFARRRVGCGNFPGVPP